LCTGQPSSVCWVSALRWAPGDRRAGATTEARRGPAEVGGGPRAAFPAGAAESSDQAD
jgi:hypothetical protein